MGRWSEGSTSRPSYMMILALGSLRSGPDAAELDDRDETMLGFRASYESGPNGMSDICLPSGVGIGLTDLR
jgi:hypothetical protein